MSGGLSVPMTAPLAWTRGGLEAEVSGAVRVLATVGALSERSPPGPEEATGIELEVARLHQKVQLLVELLAVAMVRAGSVPAATSLQLSAEGCSWLASHPPSRGERGELSLWLHAAAPEPLRWPAEIVELEAGDAGTSVHARWLPLGEAALDALERFLFQQHRRAIAEARQQRS